MEQECIVEEEAREKETKGEEKEEETLRKVTVKSLAKTFVNVNKILKMFDKMDPTLIVFQNTKECSCCIIPL